MSEDIQTALRLVRGETVQESKRRAEREARVEVAVKTVCKILDQVTPEAIDRDEIRDILDQLAGRIEYRLECMDDEDLVEGRAEDDL